MLIYFTLFEKVAFGMYKDIFSGIETGTWSSRKVSLVWRCYSLYKL